MVFKIDEIRTIKIVRSDKFTLKVYDDVHKILCSMVVDLILVCVLFNGYLLSDVPPTTTWNLVVAIWSV